MSRLETTDAFLSSMLRLRLKGKNKILSHTAAAGSVYLVNVRDEFALPWHVYFLIVGSHFALNGKK